MPQRRTKYPRELLTLEITDLREVCPLPPRARCGIPVRRSRAGPPARSPSRVAPDQRHRACAGFPAVRSQGFKPVKQVLDRAPRGYGGKTLVHVSPLPRLDIQSGGVGSWRHGAFLSGGAARRHVGNRPEGALTASSGFADAPWNRNRPRISGRGTKPPNVLNDTSHPGGTGVDRRLASRALAYGPPSSSRKAVAIALARRLSLPACLRNSAISLRACGNAERAAQLRQRPAQRPERVVSLAEHQPGQPRPRHRSLGQHQIGQHAPRLMPTRRGDHHAVALNLRPAQQANPEPRHNTPIVNRRALPPEETAEDCPPAPEQRSSLASTFPSDPQRDKLAPRSSQHVWEGPFPDMTGAPAVVGKHAPQSALTRRLPGRHAIVHGDAESSPPLPVGNKRPPISTTGNRRARPPGLRAKPGENCPVTARMAPADRQQSATRTPPRSAEVHTWQSAGRLLSVRTTPVGRLLVSAWRGTRTRPGSTGQSQRTTGIAGGALP